MKKVFTTFVLAAAGYLSHAQVIKYHDVNPDTTVSTWEVFGVLGADIWWHPSPEVVVKTWGTEVLCDNDTLPKALNANDDISGSSAGMWAELQYKCLNCGGVIGNWKGVTNKYLAVRSKDSSGNWKYGWARLDIPANANKFTIKDYARHTTANTAIKAGEAFATGIADSHVPGGGIRPVVINKEVTFAGLKEKSIVTVTDMGGKTLIAKSIDEREAISMSAYPAGVYLFRLQSAGVQQSYKLVIR